MNRPERIHECVCFPSYSFTQLEPRAASVLSLACFHCCGVYLATLPCCVCPSPAPVHRPGALVSIGSACVVQTDAGFTLAVRACVVQTDAGITLAVCVRMYPDLIWSIAACVAGCVVVVALCPTRFELTSFSLYAAALSGQVTSSIIK